MARPFAAFPPLGDGQRTGDHRSGVLARRDTDYIGGAEDRRERTVMPKLINYLYRARPARSYDDVEIARLQLVYERARERLGIGLDNPRREQLAIVIFQEADVTTDPDDLLARVVTAFEQLD
jgi:hypothetical protein